MIREKRLYKGCEIEIEEFYDGRYLCEVRHNLVTNVLGFYDCTMEAKEAAYAVIDEYVKNE